MAKRGHVIFRLTFTNSDDVVTVDDKSVWQHSFALNYLVQKQNPLHYKSTEEILVNVPPSNLNPKAVRFLFKHMHLDSFHRNDPGFVDETDELLRQVALAASDYGCRKFETQLSKIMKIG